MSETIHHQIVIGGGTAGITVAAQLTRSWFHRRDVAVIEPSDKHYYQPLWTLVGAGLAKKEATEHTEASVIPRRVTWIRDAVAEFLPDQNTIQTRVGGKTKGTFYFFVGRPRGRRLDSRPSARAVVAR